MKYEPMRDYEIDSLKSEIAESLSSGNSSSKTASEVKRQIDSAIQDLNRALSSLERNTDSRIQELKQSASSSRSSYSYSSYESGIRDARREVSRAVSKITDQLRNLPEGGGCSYGFSSRDEASRKLDKLVETLKKTSSELRSAYRHIDEMTKVNGFSSQEEIRRAQRDREKIVAKLKQDYEREIRILRQELSLKASENAALAAKIAARDKLDDDNWEPTEMGLTIVEDYAVLWNDILEDDIIELREVRHIQKWLAKNKLETPEAQALANWCEMVIARGEVLDTDAKCLYDCSFDLLNSLGAKLG